MSEVTLQPASGRHAWRLCCRRRSWPCVIGRGGLRRDKCEGDGCTPCGRFPLRGLLYRADRQRRPPGLLPCRPIGRYDRWGDVPDDPRYNRLFFSLLAGFSEDLWRRDRLYDLLVIIGTNDAPVRPGRGSAIFLHCQHPRRRPTAGCLALAPEHLLSLLALKPRWLAVPTGLAPPSSPGAHSGSH